MILTRISMILVAILFVGIGLSEGAFAEDGHDHKGTEGGRQDHDESTEPHVSHGDKENGEGHGDHGGDSFGKGKAIEAIEKDGQRFKLSKESTSFLKIHTESAGGKLHDGNLKIQRRNLVEYQDKVGVFIKRGEWFELKEAKIIKEAGKELVLKVNDIRTSDEIVVSRHGILRAAHLQATGQGGKGHAH